MVYIDLEEDHNRILGYAIWLILNKSYVHRQYVDRNEDTYDRKVTNVKTTRRETSAFPIILNLHQGSILSLYLFLFSYKWSYHIMDVVPWCMLFVVTNSMTWNYYKLDLWREAMEAKGLKLSKSKIDMEYK